MRPRASRIILGAVILVVHTATINALAAQSSDERTAAPNTARTPRWSVVVSGNVAIGRSHTGIESSMQRAGLVPDPGGCFIYCSDPATGLSSGGRVESQLTIRRTFGQYMHARALVGRSDLKHTAGYEAGGFFSASSFEQQVRTFAMLGGVNSIEPGAGGRWAQPWVGVGPALFQPQLNGKSSGKTRLGVLAATGVRMRMWGILVEPQLDYRLVGSTTNDSLPARLDFKPHLLVPARINWSHVGISIGSGFRW